MDKYQIAEKYIPIDTKSKICLIAPTGFGKTTLLNKLIGFDEASSPFSTSNATTTVFTQQLIISSSANYSEVFIKLKSEKDIIHLIENNIINAVKEASKTNEPTKIYAKLTHDHGTEFPLYYSLRYENPLTAVLLADISEIANDVANIDRDLFEEEVGKLNLFRECTSKILNHLAMLTKKILSEGRKSKDLIFEIDNNGFDGEGIWIKSKDLKAILSFSQLFTRVSNKGKDEFLTPLVSLLRLKIPTSEAQNSLMKDKKDIEVCITDTVGIGQKGSEVSSEVLGHIRSSDYFFVMQLSGTGGFNETLLKFVTAAANSGNASKLKLILTKFDVQFYDEKFEGESDEVRWEMAADFATGPIISNLQSLVYEGDSSHEDQKIRHGITITQKTYDKIVEHLETNTYFSGKFQSKNEFESQKQESYLYDLVASLDLSQRNNSDSLVPRENPENSNSELPQVQKGSNILNEIGSKQIDEILYKFDLEGVVKKFIDLEIQKYQSIWQTVKALNRRYAEKTSTNWNGLDPVSTFVQQAQEKFRKDLQQNFSFSESREDELCQMFFEFIYEYAMKSLFHDSNINWVQSYGLSGEGSTKVRKERIKTIFTDYLKRKKNGIVGEQSVRLNQDKGSLKVLHKDNTLIGASDNSFEKNLSIVINLAIASFTDSLYVKANNEVRRLCDFGSARDINDKNDFASFLSQKLQGFGGKDMETNFYSQKKFKDSVHDYVYYKEYGAWEQFEIMKDDKQEMIKLITKVLLDLRNDPAFIKIIKS